MARAILRTREIDRIKADVDDVISDTGIRTSITYRSTGSKSFTHTGGHSSSDTDVSCYAIKVSISKSREDTYQRGEWGFLVKAKDLSDQSVTPKMNDEIIESSKIYVLTRIRYGPSIPFYFFEVEGK